MNQWVVIIRLDHRHLKIINQVKLAASQEEVVFAFAIANQVSYCEIIGTNTFHIEQSLILERNPKV
jgi:hypothetical protein